MQLREIACDGAREEEVTTAQEEPMVVETPNFRSKLVQPSPNKFKGILASPEAKSKLVGAVPQVKRRLEYNSPLKE